MPTFVHHPTYLRTCGFPLAVYAHAITLEPSQERNEHLRVGAIVHGSLEVEGRVMRPAKSNPLYHSYSNHSASNLDEGAHFCDGLADLHRRAFVSTVAICTGAILRSTRAVEERPLVARGRDEV